VLFFNRLNDSTKFEKDGLINLYHITNFISNITNPQMRLKLIMPPKQQLEAD